MERKIRADKVNRYDYSQNNPKLIRVVVGRDDRSYPHDHRCGASAAGRQSLERLRTPCHDSQTYDDSRKPEVLLQCHDPEAPGEEDLDEETDKSSGRVWVSIIVEEDECYRRTG